MKISGFAGTVLFGLSGLFKMQHWPGAGIMMVIGAIVLAFVFLPSALGVLWKETHNRKRLFLFISAFFAGTLFILGTLFKIQHWPAAGILLSLAAVSGILFFIPSVLSSRLSDQENKFKRPVYIFGTAGVICYVAGMLFKIQHWPLATSLMVLGVILVCVVAFPWYTWLTWKEESHISPKFLYMVIGSLLIIVPGALVNLNLQRSYESGFYPHQDQQMAIHNYLYRNNNSLMSRYQASISYSQMEQVHSRTAELLNFICNIQLKMIQESEGKPGKPAVSEAQVKQTETGPEIQYRLLSKPFHPGPVRDFLLPGCSTRADLDAVVKDYMGFISDLKSGDDLQKYVNLLDASKYLPAESSEEWGISLMSGLHSLELMKNSVLTIESYVLTAYTVQK